MSRYFQHWRCLLLVFSLFALHGQAQQYKHLLRGFDDNDGIDIRGMGSDEGYTNGTRIELLYQPRKQHSLLAPILPKAGDSSINTYGFGIMQVMYTPNDIKAFYPLPNDYAYAGGLYLAHTFHSANPYKRINLQSEIILGFMGPGSGAEGFQKFIHRTFGFITPRGWNTQMPTDLLFNYNFTVEKQVSNDNPWIDFSIGAQGMAGTMQNSLHLFPLLRFGKKSPYYEGLIQQYTPPTSDKKDWQLYGFIKPGVQLVFYNAFYQGGMLNKHSPFNTNQEPPFTYHHVTPQTVVGRLDFGAVASTGRWSIAASQSLRTSEVKNIRAHSVGTISVQLAW
ncbi:hypothetical protein SAMN05421788_10422 [Filimonas lacunae]|uniref:Lipid A deacylase LpxR family protein n=1 Tax=Filimonas lacunae TaxID=477680 RepID=A0A173M9Q3_9BACT|nr:lipid A deacylase LpxR family protein [Filimonas lacunae]BAV04249.1 outer membrane protein [Filimonas lacunae]SIT13588.1 hypothetical protein SAMN05421788_10422 [Filimonas lacunae]